MSESKISVTVDVPDGLPPVRTLLSCSPKTTEEFNAVVAACGGPCAFKYFSESSAHADIGDGTTIIIDAPEGRRSLYYQRPLAPSIADLKAACKR